MRNEQTTAGAEPDHHVKRAWRQTNCSIPKLEGNGNSRSLCWMSLAWGAGLGGHEVEAAPDIVAEVGTDALSAHRPRGRLRLVSRGQARLEGLEPPTHCLEGSCSIPLSYRRSRSILGQTPWLVKPPAPSLATLAPPASEP